MKLLETLAVCTALGIGPARAGTAVEPAAAPSGSAGNWCDCLQDSLGLKSKGWDPWLWDMKMFGRLQWQYAYVDGQDANGEDFNYDTEEVRRFYMGGQARFLKYFQVSGRAVVANDLSPVGGDRSWEYRYLWDLGVKMDVKKMAGVEGLDALTLGYGKKQLNVSDEWHVSSKHIKTVERSAIANKVWTYTEGFANPTGAWVDLKKGAWKGTFGIFSTDHSREFSEWDDGILYYGEAFHTIDSESPWMPEAVNLVGFWQDVDWNDSAGDDERLAGGIDWAASLAGNWEHGPWEFRANLIAGDNGDQRVAAREGAFWGLVLMPSVWIVPERLDAVFRYQYQGSDQDQGIRLWSRYARRDDAVGGGPTGGRGDEHHSLYLGLNAHLCGDNLKVMTGVQYDDISSGGGDVYEGWTSFVGVRTFF